MPWLLTGYIIRNQKNSMFCHFCRKPLFVLIGRLAFIGVSFSAFLFRVLYFIRGASLVGFGLLTLAMGALFLSIFCDGLGPDFNLLTPPPIHPCTVKEGTRKNAGSAKSTDLLVADLGPGIDFVVWRIR